MKKARLRTTPASDKPAKAASTRSERAEPATPVDGDVIAPSDDGFDIPGVASGRTDRIDEAMARSRPAPAAIDDDVEQRSFDQLLPKLTDRDWRLDNLYQIRSENGDTIRFRRNESQIQYSKEMWSRDVIPKARKLGFSTLIAVLLADNCTFRAGTEGAIVDRTLDDAQDKLAMVKFAYEGVPEAIRNENPLVRANNSELTWLNGSVVTARTSPRGGTPNFLHISEYGKISTDKPDAAREIKTGGIQAVPVSGKIIVESTAHGTGGEFYDMVQTALKKQQEGHPLNELDFKLHFFGWHRKREYRIPNNLVVVPHEVAEYFEEMLHKHGVVLDADQRAWYVQKLGELGPDDMMSEFPTHVGELFYNSLKGAFWKRELTQARREGRIGHPVPFDPTRLVDTCWDIGEDGDAIICVQNDGVRHRIIDYYETTGGSMQQGISWLRRKQEERGFNYGKHYGPHDFDRVEWALNKKNRKTIAADLGIQITVVDRIIDKADSIEAARRMFAMTWIDSTFCSLLTERFDNYRKVWNKTLGVFTAEPVHDASSHPADAWQQYCMGWSPHSLKTAKKRRAFDGPKQTTPWSA